MADEIKQAVDLKADPENLDDLGGLEARIKKEARAHKVDIGALKSGGYIKQRQKDLFTVRLKVPGGRLDIDKLAKIADVAKKYSRGNDFVHVSVRQSIELLHIHIDDFDNVRNELAAVGQEIASCGPRVRVPTACGGCEYNPNGLTDTQTLAIETDKRFFGTPTHHKFKITFAGCPIDCPHSRDADLGFRGMVKPKLIEELCTGCDLCVKACQEKALVMVNDLPERDNSKCNYCGDCIKVCPFDAMLAETVGHEVYVGGKGGKHRRYADMVARFIRDEQIADFIQATLDWYSEKGVRGERIGHVIDRVGLDDYKKEVVNKFV